MTKMIDLTPTWKEALRVCLLLLEAGDAKGKMQAKVELERMAEIADRFVDFTKGEEETTTLFPDFKKVATMLCEIMAEEDRELDEKFTMPESAIEATALSLKEAYVNGFLKKDENNALYYVGMIEDYGGYFEKEIDSYKV